MLAIGRVANYTPASGEVDAREITRFTRNAAVHGATTTSAGAIARPSLGWRHGAAMEVRAQYSNTAGGSTLAVATCKIFQEVVGMHFELAKAHHAREMRIDKGANVPRLTCGSVPNSARPMGTGRI